VHGTGWKIESDAQYWDNKDFADCNDNNNSLQLREPHFLLAFEAGGNQDKPDIDG
jgi:hypothetical protein